MRKVSLGRTALSLSVAAGAFLTLLLAATCNAAPVVSAAADKKEVPVDRNVQLRVEVSWEGEADLYDVPQPELPLPEGLELVESSISSQRRDQENVLVFSYSLRPEEPAIVTIDPIEVRYFEKGVEEPLAVSTDPVEVMIVPARRLFLAFVAVLIAAAAGMVVLAAVLILRHRGRAAETSVKESLEEKRLQFVGRLEAAKELRLSGDMPEYFAELVSVAEGWAAESGCAVDEDLKDIAVRVQFAGYNPTPYELDWSYRLVDSLIVKDEAEPSDEEKEIQLEDEGN